MNKLDKDIVWKDLSKHYDLTFVTSFLNHGAKVYLFGGAPRDMVMGRKWKDADFCITLDLPPAEKDYRAEEIFKLTNISIQSKTDLGHGKTVYRFKDTQSNELVDVRVVQDMWAGGTDFTINSLRLDLETGELIDRFNAIADIQSKVLKTAVPPDEVFEENPYMIFRSVKAACQLDFTLVEEVKRSMSKFVHKIDICLDTIEQNDSDFAEWILSNMFAGLKANPHKYFSLLEEVGALKFFVGSLTNRLDIQGATFKVINPFQPDTTYDYETAISLYLTSIAYTLDDKETKNTFDKILNLLNITGPKRGDDFIVKVADIKFYAV